MAIDADLPTVSLDELLRNEKANSCADRSRARIRAKRQISPVYGDLYGAFEDEARERLRGRDEGDWPILATQRSDWLAPSGARTRTSSEQASRSGLQIVSRSSSKCSLEQSSRSKSESR